MRRSIAFVIGLAFSAGVLAQWPSKPITSVVGFEPGGGTDTTSRIVGKALGEQLGQQVVTENRSGAGGTIAVGYAAKAVPDGYTIVLANVGALAVNPHMMKLTYDPLHDLVPVSMAAIFANVLVVQPSANIKTLADYVKLAREKPGTVTYASSGVGGAGHLAGELLKVVAKADIVHVPYKGGGPAMQGFLGGQVTSFFATPISSVKQIQAGRAVAIATTGSKRAELMPDVPTVAEQGYPGFETSQWYGLNAPAKTPPAIIKRLADEAGKAARTPALVQRFAAEDAEAVGSSAQEYAQFIAREQARWKEVIERAHVKAE